MTLALHMKRALVGACLTPHMKRALVGACLVAIVTVLCSLAAVAGLAIGCVSEPGTRACSELRELYQHGTLPPLRGTFTRQPGLHGRRARRDVKARLRQAAMAVWNDRYARYKRAHGRAHGHPATHPARGALELAERRLQHASAMLGIRCRERIPPSAMLALRGRGRRAYRASR